MNSTICFLYTCTHKLQHSQKKNHVTGQISLQILIAEFKQELNAIQQSHCRFPFGLFFRFLQRLFHNFSVFKITTPVSCLLTAGVHASCFIEKRQLVCQKLLIFPSICLQDTHFFLPSLLLQSPSQADFVISLRCSAL